MSEWISVKGRLSSHNDRLLFYVLQQEQIFSVIFDERFSDKTLVFKENLDNWDLSEFWEI